MKDNNPLSKVHDSMSIGIICEYNPFHRGHQYQMEEARKMARSLGLDDTVICFMSGNFVQRGVPAFYDKFTRTKMALLSGADMVIELPTFYAAATAERFSFGAVSLMKASGLITAISFGVEEGTDLSLLEKAAAILAEEPDNYRFLLKENLSNALPYAAARKMALEMLLGESLPVSPNQILALEYLKAMKKLSFSVPVLPVIRKGASHDDSCPDEENRIASASWIRNQLTKDPFTQRPDRFIPEDEEGRPLYELSGIHSDPEKMFPLLRYALSFHTPESLREIEEVSDGLENRILERITSAVSYQDLVEKLKTSHYPTSRIRRILLNILLNITKDKRRTYQLDVRAPYIRVLGLRKERTDLLSALDISCVPVLRRAVRDQEDLDANAGRVFEEEKTFSSIYRLLDPQAPASDLQPGLILV